MNQSFDASQNSYHLPRISQHESSYLRTKVISNGEMSRSMSVQNNKAGKVGLTRKLVMMEDIRPAEEYDAMNEKQLLREHEKLLKVLKKFQEIIDINLQKKQKARERANTSRPAASKQDVLQGEIANNKKIIDNYNKQLKELEGLKKYRKLHEVIEEKSSVQTQINKLKKEIFTLKNQDNMAGRSLMADRGNIQKQLKQHEKDLKIELIKKQEYQKKMQELNVHLAQLKKECEGIKPQITSHQRSQYQSMAAKVAQKKQQLEEVTRQYVNYQQSIQQSMVAKAKRNKNLAKQIEQCQKRAQQLTHRIEQHKEKVARYQQAMDIAPKHANE